MSKLILISLDTLQQLVAERETAARLDEIKKAKVHGYTAHLKRRVAILTGKKCVRRVSTKKNKNLNTLNTRSVNLSGLKDFSDITQYLAD